MITRRHVVLGFSAAWALANARMARAQTPANPGAFIQRLGNEAIRLFGSRHLTMRQREAEFHRLFLYNFDVPEISRFVLGRFWRTATPAQRKEYQRVFADYIVLTYTIRLSRYTGETIKVTGMRTGGGYTMVKSTIHQPNGPPVNVDWRVEGSPSHYRITDVVVEGASMLVSQRDEFAAVIHSHGGSVAALISQLKNKVRELQQ